MEEKIQENHVSNPNVEQTLVTATEKKIKPLTIAILLIAILLIAGAVYAGMQLGKKQIPTSTSTQVVQPTSVVIPPTNTPDETANWKTYRNEKFKFSFKYPAYLSLLENTHSQGEAFQVFIKEGEKYLFNLEARKKYLPSEVLYYADFTSNGEKAINGTVWKTFNLSAENCGGPTCPVPVFALLIEKNGILYSVACPDQEEFIEFQNKIFSTFKFWNEVLDCFASAGFRLMAVTSSQIPLDDN